MSDGDITGYLELRPLLFAIAYRMIGAVADAEDLVQDAFLRLERARRAGTEIESERAFLTTVTTRLAIDHLRSARVRREAYVGPWLPEPLITATEPDTAEAAEMSDSLSLSFLLLLETLSPVERAVFLLREVFEYPYEEIAEVVGKSEANCRQILARARGHIDAGRPRFAAGRAEADELVHHFMRAFAEGELEDFTRLLAEDVVFYGDGGGKATAISRPVFGRRQVVRLLGAFVPRFRRELVRMEPTRVNGRPGALNFDRDGGLVSVFVLEVADGVVQAIHSIVNPDKLSHLGFPLSALARRPERSDP